MAGPESEVASYLEGLAAELGETARQLRQGDFSLDKDAKKRNQLIETANNLLTTVQQPIDQLMGYAYIFPALAAARLFVDWKVFEHVPAQGSISYSALAEKVGADVSLITRLAWTLVSTGVLKQEGADRVAHSPMSTLYAMPDSPLAATLLLVFDSHLPAIASMPEYFRKHGRKEPTARHETLWSFALGNPGDTVWDIIMRDPVRMRAFMLAMQLLEANYSFLGSYSLHWAVARAGEDPSRKMVVDVGASRGHALKAIVKATPGLVMSRCVLEDLPQVVDTVKAEGDEDLKEAELIGMDFHSEQPVRGAFVYYLRRCLHDYSDDECIGILGHIADAMAEDSRLLVVEQILTNPPSHSGAALNIYMMTISGIERTVEGFRAIIEAVGLKMLKVWEDDRSDFGVIECAKA